VSYVYKRNTALTTTIKVYVKAIQRIVSKHIINVRNNILLKTRYKD